MKRNEQRLADLRKLSSNILPLKLRRIKPSKPTTVKSLCDWEDEDVREDKYDIILENILGVIIFNVSSPLSVLGHSEAR